MSLDNGVLYAIEVPAGEVRDPNQVPEDMSLVVVTIVSLTLATVSMGVRMYTRSLIVGRLSFDDYIMTLAWICATLMAAFVLNLHNYGVGKHLWNVAMSPELYPNFMLNNMLAAIFFCAATGFAKASILLFYLRIFPIRFVHMIVWSAFAFVIGYSTACVLVNIFACTPIRASWELDAVAGATCINRPIFYFFQAGLGILADIVTVAIPIPWLRTLQLPAKQKIGVGFLLMIGASVCVISVVRLQSLNVLLQDADLTNNTVIALMWCVLEINLSIIGGSIPTVKPFIRRVLPGILGTSKGKSGQDIYLQSTGRTPRSHAESTPGVRSNYRGMVSANTPESDRGSEELIIAKHDGSGGAGDATIVKTVQYGFEVDSVSKRSSGM